MNQTFTTKHEKADTVVPADLLKSTFLEEKSQENPKRVFPQGHSLKPWIFSPVEKTKEPTRRDVSAHRVAAGKHNRLVFLTRKPVMPIAF
jgi:hypothetical protein